MRTQVTFSAACPSPGTTPWLEHKVITLRRAARTSSFDLVRRGRNNKNFTASDAASGDLFGSSVSISGDYAVVGARQDNSNAGSAYIFVRSGTTWTQQQKLTASDAASYDWFGASVSVSGNYAVVGAYGNDDAGTYSNSGSAYIFVRSGTTWTQQQKLTASDAAVSDRFGVSVSVSGDYAVVGANGDNSHTGSAYIFVRSGTTWTQQQKLTASDAVEADSFGVSVSVSGDYAVVGAYDTNDGGTNSGSAYIFVRSGTTWTQQQKLTASDAAASDWFGASVSVSGNYAVVGAYGNDDAGTYSNSGSAYIFVRSGTTWTQQQKLTASDAAASDAFGMSVSVSGDYAVVGAYDTNDGANLRGSAYVFVMSCDASTAPTNGGVGSCTSSLATGSTCQPTCNSGYTVSGTSSCNAGTLTAATCSANARRVHGSHQWRRRDVHEFIGVWIHVPADVQQYTVSGTSSCSAGTLTAATCSANCDASTAPANGGVGTCTSSLASGSTCQPTCNSGYTCTSFDRGDVLGECV